MANEPLIIRRRGEDGTKVISVRLREETLNELDRIAKECNYSRNEIINIILDHGVKNVTIK
ncbi:MAG: ribbon-helix-helix protein, CopG family [Clostridia bacterium]|nr:ribbon-helix-helix protein, CopG family [Clostridia bacterium]MBQ1434522.1 ribbon-helix-helix protein, CopG family [Clostridia bacterium]